jgi:uncharacterized protein
MILDLKHQEEFPVWLDQTTDFLSEKLDREDVLKVNKVRLELQIQQTGEEYYCQGTVTADFQLECARCLVPFEVQLSGPTDFIIRSPQVTNDEERDVPDDEDYVDLLDNQKVDLSGIIRQTLLLALPMRPICNENCRGLCPMCGVNRNEKDCACKTEKFDPRWEGLSGLLSDT